MGNGEIIFWNSVFNRTNISEHKKRFNEYPYPDNPIIKRWILVWELRVKDPEIIEVKYKEGKIK